MFKVKGTFNNNGVIGKCLVCNETKGLASMNGKNFYCPKHYTFEIKKVIEEW